jgi:hypothetical protein
MPRELHLLLGRQIREDFLLEPAGFLLELADLGGEVDGRGRQPAKLADLLFEVDDRPLEFEDHPIGELRWFERHELCAC